MRSSWLVAGLLCGALALVPGAAAAHMLGLRLDSAKTPPTATSQVSGSNAATLNGSYDVNDDVSIDGGLGLTRPISAPPGTAGVEDKTNGGTVVNLSAGSSWYFNDNWFFMGALSFSPRSTSLSSETATFTGDKGGSIDGDALIKAISSSAGLLLSATWESAGESDWEHAVGLTLNGSHLSTTQKLQELDTGKQTTDLAQLRNYCNAGGKGTKLCKHMRPLLAPEEASVNSLSVNLLVTETLKKNTDVLVGGTYYLYDRDPNEVGYFTIATAGKAGAPLARSSDNGRGVALSSGTGMAIAPNLWAGQLGVSQKFGDLRVTLTGAYGQYVDDGGDSRSVLVKAGYKVSAMWRIYASLAAQRDVDENGTGTNSFSGSVTVRAMF